MMSEVSESCIPTRTHAQRVAEAAIITTSIQADIRRAFELRDQEIDALRLRVEQEAAEVRRLSADRDQWRVSCERAASDENDNAADLERVTKERDEVRAALATARLDGARAMREALAPFAAYAGVYTDDAPDDAIVLRHVGATATRTITIGDFRRALDPAAVVGSGS